MGGSDPDVLSSLASRLARLAKECGPAEDARIREASGGVGLRQMAHGIVDALDTDSQHARARSTRGLTVHQGPTEPQLEQAAEALAKEAVEPLATRPGLRQLLQDIKRELEQVIDEVSKDALRFAGASAEAKVKAKALVASFEQFIAAIRLQNIGDGVFHDELAPLPEQHRIVEAIESYFTRLDDAVATLERGQRNLKRYRASVLKAAVEGRLVPTPPASGQDFAGWWPTESAYLSISSAGRYSAIPLTAE